MQSYPRYPNSGSAVALPESGTKSSCSHGGSASAAYVGQDGIQAVYQLVVRIITIKTE